MHRVLVVSADPHLREEAEYAFPLDTTVVLATDAGEAWKLLEESAPHVVVVDLQSRNAGGFALARDMSQVERFRSIPVLMLLQRIEDTWLAQQAGAKLIRTKPIESSELVKDALGLIAA